MAGWLTDRGPQAKEALISSLRQQLEAAQQEVALQAAKAASLQVCPPPATCRSRCTVAMMEMCTAGLATHKPGSSQLHGVDAVACRP